ncbi:MAG: hypothetical protein IPN94_27115 [Sphingobacteriales bacterium]|nr:hypothetical protein [Sphingobacteriales bacterium]
MHRYRCREYHHIAQPNANITGNTAICSGSSTSLDAGSGFAAYVWNTGSITQNITVNAAGTYTVTVTNANGCTGTDAVIITTSPNPTPNITGNTAICSGNSTSLDAGSGFVAYTWNTGSIAQNITVNAAGTYTVTVTNANGCTGTDAVIITTSPNPTPNITGNTAICSGNSTSLDAGSGFAAYTWNTGSITQNITVNAAGTYTVTVTNVNGCTGTDAVSITTSPNPTPNITGNTAICSGNSTSLDAGSGFAAYAWNTGSITQNITVNAAGTYTVTVTNANGCTGTDAVIITTSPNPTPNIIGNTAICSGASTSLDAGSGFAAYTWNTGSIAQNITVNAAGTYTVTVTNANGCTVTRCRDCHHIAQPNTQYYRQYSYLFGSVNKFRCR